MIRNMIGTFVPGLLSALLISLAAQAQPAGALQRGGIPVRPIQLGYCTAVAPADWRANGTDPQGRMLEMTNGAFRTFYFIFGVDGISMQGIPVFQHPSFLVQDNVSKGFMGDPILQASQPQPYLDTYVQEFQSARFHAVAVYNVWPIQMGGYVVLMRIASGPREYWPVYGPTAVAIAATMRCRAQVSMSSSSSTSSGGRGARDSGYNVQLGTEYAHDPETGEPYLMNHANDWQETGPDGPGYYKQRAGGGLVRLSPGLGQ